MNVKPTELCGALTQKYLTKKFIREVFLFEVLHVCPTTANEKLKFHYPPNAFGMNTKRDCRDVNFSIFSYFVFISSAMRLGLESGLGDGLKRK